jgi:RNA polymerase sigma-70 factor (ECF subfamily)
MVSTTHSPSVHNRQSDLDAAVGSWDLVAAAQAGDREAFGRLYARYAAQVQRVVTAKVRDRHLAEDLTSETFAQALRAINAVSDRGRDVGVWLHVIARNRVRDHAKSSRARYETPVAEIPDTAAGLSPEDVVVAREAAATVRCHVAQLPADQRQVLHHRFVEDRTVAQTAAVMDRTAASVKALQYRALSHLRTALATDDRTGSAGQQAAADPLARARAAVAAAEHRVAQHRAAARQTPVPAPDLGQVAGSGREALGVAEGVA